MRKGLIALALCATTGMAGANTYQFAIYGSGQGTPRGCPPPNPTGPLPYDYCSVPLNWSGVITITTPGDGSFSYVSADVPQHFSISSIASGMNQYGIAASFAPDLSQAPPQTIVITADGPTAYFGLSDRAYSASYGTTMVASSSTISATGHGTSGVGYILSGTVTPIPEPSTYALLALGLGAVAFKARKRK